MNLLQNSIRNSLKNYIDYLIIKERTHISILSYLHQLPGLIHFIYVDRSTNRVIAPSIGPVHGQQCNPHEETTKHMVNLITKKVNLFSLDLSSVLIGVGHVLPCPKALGIRIQFLAHESWRLSVFLSTLG